MNSQKFKGKHYMNSQTKDMSFSLLKEWCHLLILLRKDSDVKLKSANRYKKKSQSNK